MTKRKCYLVRDEDEVVIVWAKDEEEAAEKATVELWAPQLLREGVITDVTEKVMAGVRPPATAL